MFYKQHLIAIDSFLNEIEGKVSRAAYNDLTDTSADMLNCIMNAGATYARGMILNAAGWLEEADMLIDDFVGFAQSLDNSPNL